MVEDLYWLQAEKRIDRLLKDGGWFVEKMKDSRSAGRLMATWNTADRIVSKDNFMCYLEIKSTIHEKYVRSKLSRDQIAKQMSACMKGAPGMYAFVLRVSTDPVVLFVPMSTAVKWFYQPGRVPAITCETSSTDFWQGCTLSGIDTDWTSWRSHIISAQVVFDSWIRTKPRLRHKRRKIIKGIQYDKAPNRR